MADEKNNLIVGQIESLIQLNGICESAKSGIKTARLQDCKTVDFVSKLSKNIVEVSSDTTIDVIETQFKKVSRFLRKAICL